VKRNQFGGSIGGPIEGQAVLLRRCAAPAAAFWLFRPYVVPTAGGRGGNFNEYLGGITTPGLSDATCAASPGTRVA